MLTKEHAIADYSGRFVRPDRLTRRAHGNYVDLARQLLELYRGGIGCTRHELREGVRRILGQDEDCPPRRMEAFCKLLDEANVAKYQTDTLGKAASLRLRVFRKAAAFHPLVSQRNRLFEHSEMEVKARVAEEFGEPWESIDGRLFADVIDFHRLVAFTGYPSPVDLLSRYNVAQLQAVLYCATRLTVWARKDFKTILRYAKLAQLMHRISRDPQRDVFKIELAGPASVLRETRRYGARMARFLPALLACQDWELQAAIQRGRGSWKKELRLAATDGYHSHLPEPEEFDSSLELQFWKKWGEGDRNGWRLIREGEILDHGQHTFVPDFTLIHKDGQQVMLEIVGFWTPEYIKAKVDTLRSFPDKRILLAVAERIDLPEGIAEQVLRFKSALKLRDVEDWLANRMPQLPAVG